MKTPEEIKKGLYCCCVDSNGRKCNECPYGFIDENYCDCNLEADALKYIQQLENHIGELTENVAQLEAEQQNLFCDFMDYIDDRERKGRNKPPKGVRNGNAKLTEDDVISARHERLQNNTSFQKLADKYGVSKHTIQDAVTGKRWAHVVMPEPQKEDA